MNWPQLMAMGFGRLGLSPDSFWSMTPREFSAAVRGLTGHSAAAPLDRGAFDALAARYPDEDLR